MKRLYKVKIIKKLIFMIFRMFFEDQYMKGRYFDDSLKGSLWAVKCIWTRNILRLNRPLPFPAAHTCNISSPKKIFFHPDDINNFQSPGTYFQNFKANIYLGRGVYIAPNVGIITANHDHDDLDLHLNGQDVVIGDSCWLGMNCVVLPGVTLGPHTTVAAGAVVTKSYPDGFVVLAGVPAKPIKAIPKD